MKRFGPAYVVLVLVALVAVALWVFSNRGADRTGGAADSGGAGGPSSRAAGAADGIFEDVTTRAGIDFVHHLGDGRMDTILESVGSGATVFDYDGDGHVDLYFVDQGWREGVSDGAPPETPWRNRLFRNRGDGTFEDVTSAAGVGDAGFGFAAVAADLDADGWLDLYVLNDGPNRLYRNRGDGTFEDVTDAAGVAGSACSVGAAVLDADQDGDLDLYVANYVTFDKEYRLHYAPDVFPGPLAFSAQGDTLYVNRGNGVFEDRTADSGLDGEPGRSMGAVAFDYDADGRTDVFVANDATANYLFRNLGGGRFEEVGLESGMAFGFQGEASAAMGGIVGDYDLDGLPDVFVTDDRYGALYRNLGGGRFEDRVLRSGVAPIAATWANWGGGWLDFDLDGDLDLFVASGDLHHMTGRPDLLFENLGDGSFADAGPRGGAPFRAARLSRGALVLDFDDDGRPDLLVTHIGEGPALLRNRMSTGHHWIALDLSQRTGGRIPFGARVRIEVAGRAFMRTLHPPTTYLSQSDARLHFGLGAAARVDRLEVTWPDGKRQTHDNVDVDRIWRVVRGGALE